MRHCIHCRGMYFRERFQKGLRWLMGSRLRRGCVPSQQGHDATQQN
jgi:hypothetical protein